MEDNPEHRRLKDEAELAKSLSQVIDHHNKEMVRIRKVERDVDRNHVQTDFTAAEKKILHVGNYRNHTLGLIAGGLTMAGLFGIARFRSSGSLRSIPVGRLKADAVRTRTYRNIDGPSSKGTATDSSSIQPGNVESADVVGTLQNMVFGAVSLIVTIVATNATFDRNAYSQGISSIPLQPGRSLFCHRACPDLLKRYQELNKQTLAYGNRPADLLKNPVMDELSAMKVMMFNCQQRMAYTEQLRAGKKSTGDIMEIPEPGVPHNFLGLSIDQE